jgi:uncharacterized protein
MAIKSGVAKLTVVLFCLVHAAAVGAQNEYREEDVKFKKGDDTIAGILLFPNGSGPFPAVVFLHGSEAGSRKMPHYRRAAEKLVKAGIAVLITDKRGVGDSTGTYIETPDLRVPAADVVAKVEYLTSRKDINAEQIGLMGWSQGGWVGPLAAMMSEKIAFVITISGPAVTIQEQVIYQRGQELLDAGLTPQDVEAIASFRRRLWTYYGTGQGFEEMQKLWEQEKGKPWFARAVFANQTELEKPSALAHPQYQFFRNIQYDPEPVLAKMKVPLLAIFGEKDRLIPVSESTEKMQAIFARNGHKDVTIKIFPQAGHGIQVIDDAADKPLPNGSGKSPAKPPVPAPGYWELVVDWIASRTLTGGVKVKKKAETSSNLCLTLNCSRLKEKYYEG